MGKWTAHPTNSPNCQAWEQSAFLYQSGLPRGQAVFQRGHGTRSWGVWKTVLWPHPPGLIVSGLPTAKFAMHSYTVRSFVARPIKDSNFSIGRLWVERIVLGVKGSASKCFPRVYYLWTIRFLVLNSPWLPSQSLTKLLDSTS